MPDNASVKSFGGTGFINANKSNSPQDKAASGTANPFYSLRDTMWNCTRFHNSNLKKIRT